MLVCVVPVMNPQLQIERVCVVYVLLTLYILLVSMSILFTANKPHHKEADCNDNNNISPRDFHIPCLDR